MLPPDEYPGTPPASAYYPGEGPPPLPEYDAGPAPLERVPWRWWEPIVVFVFSFVSSNLFAAVLGVVVGGSTRCFTGDLSSARCDVGIATALLVGTIGLGAWVLIWVKIRFNAGPKILGLTSARSAKDIWAGLATGIVGYIGAILVVGVIVNRLSETIAGHPIEAPNQLPFERVPSTIAIVITGIAVVLIAPIAEELFFRGFVYQGLRRRLGVAVSAVLSALVFAIPHIQSLTLGFLALLVPVIFALGTLLALVFERRRSIVPTIVAHATFNLINYALLVANYNVS